MLDKIKTLITDLWNSEDIWGCRRRTHVNCVIIIILLILSSFHSIGINIAMIIIVFSTLIIEAKWNLKQVKKIFELWCNKIKEAKKSPKREKTLDHHVKKSYNQKKVFCIILFVVVFLCILFRWRATDNIIYFIMLVLWVVLGTALGVYYVLNNIIIKMSWVMGKVWAFSGIFFWICAIMHDSNNACMILTIAAVMVQICQNLKKVKFFSLIDMLFYIGVILVGIYSIVDILPCFTWARFWNIASFVMLFMSICQSYQSIVENKKAIEENNEDKKALEQEKNKEIRSKIEEILTKNLEQPKKDNSVIDVSKITQEIMDTIKGSR